MKRYIALLRGINISGKNKIAMSELKAGFTESGFMEVSTYINSGNAVFLSDMENRTDISDKIRNMIRRKFNLEIPVFIITLEELEDILNHAPDWWGHENKDIYDNLIFIASSASYEEIFREIGEPEKEYEKIENYRNAIFWSFIRKDYKKTNWWAKTANTKINEKITIRTAGTVKKVVDLCKK